MKNKFPLIVALFVGILGLLAVRSYVNKKEQQARDQLKGTPIVAANVDIAAGTEISMQMIVPKEVPDQFIPSQAIQGSSEVKQIVGRKTRVPIHAGQIILWSDLASEERGGLSTMIPEGQGAYTVSFSKGIKPGLIQPGDHIDIIGSFAVPKPTQPLPDTAATWREGSDMVNVALLQNVTVLAIGESFGGSPTAENAAGGGDLTLALNLQEAQLLMFATEHGEVGAVLRREGATQLTSQADMRRITFDSIEQIIGDLDQKRNYRSVEVQKGAKSIAVPVSNSTTQ